MAYVSVFRLNPRVFSVETCVELVVVLSASMNFHLNRKLQFTPKEKFEQDKRGQTCAKLKSHYPQAGERVPTGKHAWKEIFLSEK